MPLQQVLLLGQAIGREPDIHSQYISQTNTAMKLMVKRVLLRQAYAWTRREGYKKIIDLSIHNFKTQKMQKNTFTVF